MKGPQVVCYAASVGHSIWFSEDLGDSWLRAPTPDGGLYNESRCWSLGLRPDGSGEVWAGTDQGLYVWRRGEGRWRHMPSPLDPLQVLKIARSPHAPGAGVVGTRPAAVFVTRDGGRTWRRARLPVESECGFINTPRVTSLQFDPLERDTVWMTIEIAGVFRSRDGGLTWTACNAGLRDVDVHNLAIIDEDGPRRILASTEVGLHLSTDGGESWTFHDVPVAREHVYFRCLARRADRGGVLFLSIGDRPSGRVGRLLRSRDYGRRWEEVKLPVAPNTTIWWIHTNPEDSNFVLAATIFGEVYRSLDGGESWTRSARVLGELREIAWQRLPGADP